jgi:hypothetical protein
MDVERMDCRTRHQLFVVIDQNHMTRLMGQRRHYVCLKHLGCLVHYDYREVDGLKQVCILSSPCRCHCYYVLLLKKRDGINILKLYLLLPQ